VGHTHAGALRYGKKLRFTTLITPSKHAVKRPIAGLNKIIRHYTPASQEKLINKISPIIRGWSLYYRSAVASEIFNAWDFHVYKSLESGARRRHPNKTTTWRAHRYWNRNEGHNWTFAVQQGAEADLRLTYPIDTHSTRHVKVKDCASPFDGNLRYWQPDCRNIL
jgi:RNA-directed DNA polymerase